jgi:iron complex transport system ATP-binding protein
MTLPKTLLSAANITARLGGVTVLDGVDLDLRQGEVLGLIGPNGAGKSSLIRVLAGLIEPDRGEVKIAGRPLAEFAPADLARQIGYFPQAASVHWPISVEALAALGRLPHRQASLSPWGGGPNASDRAAIERALAAADVTSFRHADVTQLSAGERARALLARALAVEAPILLADEPVAALDPLHQLSLMQVLQTYAKQGAGVVVVLHDLSLAARFCHRLALLHQGKLVAKGVPDLVLTAERIEFAFGVHVEFGRKDGSLLVTPWKIVGDIVGGDKPTGAAPQKISRPA